MQTQKQKPKVKIEYLINWYFGTFCYRCRRIDSKKDNYGRNCYNKIQKIGSSINLKELTHKQFREIIKNSLFCKPIKRQFSTCPICEKLGSKTNF